MRNAPVPGQVGTPPIKAVGKKLVVTPHTRVNKVRENDWSGGSTKRLKSGLC